MAINPEAQYPGKITPATPQFPFGSARNVTVPGDGTGTPWEAALLNDIFGLQQAVLSEVSIVPSGTPDEVGASQYLDALKARFSGPEFISTTAMQSAPWLTDGMKVSTGGTIWDVTTVGDLALTPGGLFARKKQFLNIQDFGAVPGETIGTGADALAAIQAAVDAITHGDIYIPGHYTVSGDINVADKDVRFCGDGQSMSSITLTSGTSSSVMFNLSTTKALSNLYQFASLTLACDTVDSGTCIKMTTPYSGSGTDVNGARDALTFNSVRMWFTGSGYWRHYVHTINTGGVTSYNLAMINHNAAQTNINVEGVRIETDNVNVNVIKAFRAHDIYMLRANTAFVTFSAGGSSGIESLYLLGGEIVGVRNSFEVEGGRLGAVTVVGTHFDVTSKMFDASAASTSVNVVRFTGADIRQANNGETFIASAMFTLGEGEGITFSACVLSGNNNVISSASNITFEFVGASPTRNVAMAGNQFRNFFNVYGLLADAENLSLAGNAYQGIEDTLHLESPSNIKSSDTDYVYLTEVLTLAGTATEILNFTLPTSKFQGAPFCIADAQDVNIRAVYGQGTSTKTNAEVTLHNPSLNTNTIRVMLFAGTLSQGGL